MFRESCSAIARDQSPPPHCHTVLVVARLSAAMKGGLYQEQHKKPRVRN